MVAEQENQNGQNGKLCKLKSHNRDNYEKDIFNFGNCSRNGGL